jgi:hypothetical protein
MASPSASAGKHISLDRVALNGLIQGLKIAGTTEYLGRRADLDAIKRAALAKLKDEFFPYDPSQRKDGQKEYPGHLRTGWRAFDFSEGGKIGFTIRNVLADENPRIQTILSALDKGSRGYIRELNGKRALSFIGIPGRATRSSEKYAPWIFTSRHIYIPSRRPVNYIEKTFRFVDDMLRAKFPEYIRGLRQDMRRWTNRD